ncbi:MAG: Protein RnfH [Stenotrophomonas maltophilia]|uniref:UPF0125 protein GAK31_00813 n=1 Tax=Stenotrophomonas maltophilia TaxID=40324 RepID=A0A7V8JNB4_STEMA|nr:MAG: Protein RnfH [Stenotrophomonas maltophilia]
MIAVEVVLAWPGRVDSRTLQLAEDATVADAVAACGIAGAAECPAVAVHGVLAPAGQRLLHGDRVELLRPLLADPKDNRRRRARGG